MLNDFGGGQGAHPRTIFMRNAARKAQQKTCGKEIACTGCINQRLNRESADGLCFLTRYDQ